MKPFKNIALFFRSVSGAEAVGLLILLALAISLAYAAIFTIIRVVAGVVAFFTI